MSNSNPCCQASRKPKRKLRKAEDVARGRTRNDFDTVIIPSAKALVGTAYPQIKDDGEGPLRRVSVKAFAMGTTVVTNAQFEAFVAETGYVTEAERFGWSFVFWSDVPIGTSNPKPVPGLDWWRAVDRADWRNIHGPKADPAAWKPDHPVTQVSWADANAFARWVGGRLPSEAEWEHAARGGLGDVKYPWGDEAPDDEENFPCNIWQGEFPKHNTAADGFRHTCPVKSYAPNGYGLYNMVGNVWEWTADPFTIKSLKKSVRHRLADMKGFRLSKGGSFLCHKSYCYRYRIAARSGTSPDSASPHQGFRIAWDVS